MAAARQELMNESIAVVIHNHACVFTPAGWLPMDCNNILSEIGLDMNDTVVLNRAKTILIHA